MSYENKQTWHSICRIKQTQLTLCEYLTPETKCIKLYISELSLIIGCR